MEEVIYYITDDLIKEAEEYGYATCPLCKEEKEFGGKVYKKRKLQITDGFGYCHRCNTKFYTPMGYYKIQTSVFKPLSEARSVKYADVSFVQKKLGFLDEERYDYIYNRNKYLSRSFLRELNISNFENNIYIPFYFRKELFYYQIRFLNNDKYKYFNPPVEDKPFYLCGKFRMDKPFMLVEGCFDAFAVKCVFGDEFNVIALLGHSFSSYQNWLLKNYIKKPVGFVVFMDDTEKSRKVCSKLKNFRYDDIALVKVPKDTDPEEILMSKGKDGFLRYFETNIKLIY